MKTYGISKTFTVSLLIEAENEDRAIGEFRQQIYRMTDEEFSQLATPDDEPERIQKVLDYAPRHEADKLNEEELAKHFPE